MRVLIFANTPAHVHLYRNLVGRLEERGHAVQVLGRDYGCTAALLEHYGLPHRLYGRQATSFRSLARNVPRQFVNVARLSRSYAADLVFGRGAYAALAGTFTRTPVVLVLDSEPSELGHALSSRFAERVLTPAAFERDLGEHHRRFGGLTECAYLHPDVYTPDPGVRTALGIGPVEPFALVRFNAFDALHDVGSRRAPSRERATLLERLAERVQVFVSDEGGTLELSDLPVRPYEIHPARMHDVLAEARLFVTDTGTMATEAALLGTPTVRFVDGLEQAMGEFRELERSGLLVQRSTLADVVRVADRLLGDPSVPARWNENRLQYLSRAENLTELLVEVAERFDDDRRRVDAAGGDSA